MNEKSDFSAAIKDLATHQARWVRSHPDAEELMAYVAQELPEEQREVVEEHLARCRECRVLVQDFAELQSEDEPSFEAELDDEEVEAGLVAVKAKVAAVAEEPESNVVPIERHRQVVPAPAFSRWWAAVFAAALVGLAILLGMQKSEIEGMRRQLGSLAKLGLVTQHLALIPATGATTRSGHETAVIDAAEDANLTLELMDAFDQDTSVQVSFREKGGRRVLEVEPSLAKKGSATLSLNLPASSLPPGVYELTLSYAADETVITRYELQVR